MPKSAKSKHGPIAQASIDFAVKIGRLISKIHQFFSVNNYHKRRHIEISWEEGRLYIDNFSHLEYLDYIREQILQLNFTHQPEDHIYESLKLTRRCNYIIFDGKERGAYIQFWLGDGEFELVWPIVKENNLKKYTSKMLDVLYSVYDSELTLNRQPLLPRNKKSLIKKDILYNQDEVRLRLGKRIDLASEFTNRVYIEVFKQDLKDLVFELG